MDARLKCYVFPIGVIINSIWIDRDKREETGPSQLFQRRLVLLLATGKT